MLNQPTLKRTRYKQKSYLLAPILPSKRLLHLTKRGGKQEPTNKSNVVIENSESLTEWKIMFVYDDGLCNEKSTMNQVRCKGKKRGIREVIARIF